jgi:NDP-sugar pyrophosphorylase family protein
MPELELPDLFADLTDTWRDDFDSAAPWELLGEPLRRVLDSQPSAALEISVQPDAHLIGDRIVIGKGTRILPGAVVEGPIYIGQDVVIRPGAYLRGGNWIGDGCVVGASTEIKHAILFPGAKAPHLSYVGDSILGADVNLGAGTILSNFRHDGAEISIPTGDARLATGRRKLGAILGDGVRTGCNCVLHPGAIVGRGTLIYPGVQLRSGVFPADSIIKLRQDLAIVERTS